MRDKKIRLTFTALGLLIPPSMLAGILFGQALAGKDLDRHILFVLPIILLTSLICVEMDRRARAKACQRSMGK